MKYIRFTKWTEEDLGISAEDLMRALAEMLLQSGFDGQQMQFQQLSSFDPDDLRRAIEQALFDGSLFPEGMSQEALDQLLQMSQEQIDQLVEKLMQKLQNEGFMTPEQDGEVAYPNKGINESNRKGELGQGKETHVQLKITDKAVDFLGFKTLKDLLGSLGRSSFGAHDTRDMATGVESSGSTKQYEFGDTLNLDVGQTLFSAMQREGVKVPLDISYEDLHVHQSEYQSSCATVVMLDCSHSMILYGEDRFTPAKKVALALATLIRTQYPGDSLKLVLFHDTAEELNVNELARVQVGPYYTNTRDGLILAQRLLARERKDMKQIIMITDGKPSVITLEDGRVYRNAFGLDPLVISRTLEEVNRCKRQNILINTFMLARDYSLVQFVQQVTQMCRGKAYFTTPYTLGQYLLMDYMNRKTKSIH